MRSLRYLRLGASARNGGWSRLADRQRGLRRGRTRRVDPGGFRAQPKFLQAQRIDLPSAIKSVIFLETAHSLDAGSVPSAVRICLVVAAVRESRLDLRDALGGRLRRAVIAIPAAIVVMATPLVGRDSDQPSIVRCGFLGMPSGDSVLMRLGLSRSLGRPRSSANRDTRDKKGRD